MKRVEGRRMERKLALHSLKEGWALLAYSTLICDHTIEISRTWDCLWGLPELLVHTVCSCKSILYKKPSYFPIESQRERYQKLRKIIIDDKISKELKGKREIQLADLRQWERKINSICSDPAKLCVENTVDLELPNMEFVYINECRVCICWDPMCKRWILSVFVIQGVGPILPNIWDDNILGT